MRNPQGYATVVGDLQAGEVSVVDHGVKHRETEIDTFTCGHCNRVVHVPPKSDAANLGGLCKQCMSLICPRCVEKQSCTPWEKKMEIAERRDRLYEAMRL